jgi:hypothetical protein
MGWTETAPHRSTGISPVAPEKPSCAAPTVPVAAGRRSAPGGRDLAGIGRDWLLCNKFKAKCQNKLIVTSWKCACSSPTKSTKGVHKQLSWNFILIFCKNPLYGIIKTVLHKNPKIIVSKISNYCTMLETMLHSFWVYFICKENFRIESL